MNILIDFITLSCKTGAGEYLRRVIKEIPQTNGVTLFALTDSSLGIAYDDMKQSERFIYIDVQGKTLPAIINQYQIDRFFIGCAQYVLNYKGFANLKCEVICVIHDLASQELNNENLNAYIQLEKHKGVWSFLFWRWRKRNRDIKRGSMQPVIDLLRDNPKASLVVVSEATRHSVRYHLRIPYDRMRVLYSPERVYVGKEKESACLENIQGEKFFLLLGLERRAKNGMKVVRAFEKFVKDTGLDYKLLTVGYKGKPLYEQHIPVHFLSDEELHWAYQNCVALLYPSFFEGFGYPPLEAMSCGRPVIASNIAPIREIFQDAPLYFCPFFESDIYQALERFTEQDYDDLCGRSRACYERVSQRQHKDLATLVHAIVG